MTADDGRLYPSYISQGRDGPVYGRPQNMVDGRPDGTVRNTDRGLLVFPLVTVREEVISRLASTTIVFRVAPPAVVARSVIRALQVHDPEGMPGLELVEPRGRSLLRPGWGSDRACLSPGGRTPC